MSEASKLKAEYERQLEELQKRCLHEVTNWRIEAWAPAHYTGSEVEVCDNCWKHLGRRAKETVYTPLAPVQGGSFLIDSGKRKRR